MKPITSWTLLAFGLIACAAWLHQSATAAVVGIDYGTEYYKIMLIKGKSFDIVLNEQSNRKTYSSVAFTDDGERLFGAPSQSLVCKKH
jgi:hypoxia up-regulated 1